MVCLPMGRDQNDTAARIVHRGAGVRLSPRASANKIRAAVERVLTDPSYLQKARDLGRAISDGEGCVDMIDAIERLAGQRRAPQAPAA
jgi:UDP:flavonoid glycosyltransferase YjiC (YdhE family)